MSEYIGSNFEASDDDDDSESESSKEHASVKQFGEILLGSDKVEAETDTSHETFWDRLGEKDDEETPTSLFEVAAEEQPEEDEEPGLFEVVRDEETPSEEATEDKTESQAAENGETDEGPEVPDDTLAEDEVRTVVESYDADRTDELAAERETVEPNSEEDAAIAANELFIDKVEEKLDNPGKSAAEAIDEAAAETEQALDEIIEAPSEAQTEAPEAITEVDPETIEQPLDEAAEGEIELGRTETDEIETTEEPESEETTAETGPSMAPETADAEDEDTTASSATNTAGSGAGGSGSGTPPPGSPPYGSFPPFGGSPFGPRAPGVGPSFNTLNASGPTPEDVEAARRHGETTGLVVGGILGYLLGRRRGRKKTEAKLLPVQHKLERQVTDLHETVAAKEREIRNLAAQKFRAVEAAKREQVVEKLRPQPRPPRQLPFDRTATEVRTAPLAAFELGQTKFRQADRLAPFAGGLPPEQNSGNFRPEYRSATTGQIVDIFPTNETAPLPTRHIENVERLSRREILEMSEKVIIGGARLRDIYEGRQITEMGLKHVLTEFLSGGDVKKALDQELLVKELTYERDPRMRDSLSAGYGSSAGAATGGPTGGVTPDQLSIAEGKRILQNVELQGAQRAPQQSDIPDEAELRARRTEQLIVTGWGIVVVILIVVIVWLLLRRGGH